MTATQNLLTTVVILVLLLDVIGDCYLPVKKAGGGSLLEGCSQTRLSCIT